MNLIAMVVLAPTLGFQTHVVLLSEQLDEPLANTIGYFAVNYTILAVGLGIATLIHRRHFAADPRAVDTVATHS